MLKLEGSGPPGPNTSIPGAATPLRGVNFKRRPLDHTATLSSATSTRGSFKPAAAFAKMPDVAPYLESEIELHNADEPPSGP
jgi:hypothetical protein